MSTTDENVLPRELLISFDLDSPIREVRVEATREVFKDVRVYLDTTGEPQSFFTVREFLSKNYPMGLSVADDAVRRGHSLGELAGYSIEGL